MWNEMLRQMKPKYELVVYFYNVKVYALIHYADNY